MTVEPGTDAAGSRLVSATTALAPPRVALVYDMDACRGPTGVTRHALSQLERLARRKDVALSVVSGRMKEPDGLAYWESIPQATPKKELPLRLIDAIRLWRVADWPPVDWWTGPIDWVYCPAELYISARKAKHAVTSHDVLQDIRYGGPRRLAMLDKVFHRADLVLSVSRFNTERLLEHFPQCRGRVAYVPNGAEDLFYEEATAHERSAIRSEFQLPPGLPYLISVANFQPRKNLVGLVKAVGRLPEVASGELGLVLLGTGSESQAKPIREAVAELGRKAIVRMPGYRQGRPLRAAYAEAAALVFSSTCESFGIPAVEAMAQGLPIALADTTALPEIGGEAGWYFNPHSEDALTACLRDLLDNHDVRRRRSELGLQLAQNYRWQTANDLLAKALLQGPSS